MIKWKVLWTFDSLWVPHPFHYRCHIVIICVNKWRLMGSEITSRACNWRYPIGCCVICLCLQLHHRHKLDYIDLLIVRNGGRTLGAVCILIGLSAHSRQLYNYANYVGNYGLEYIFMWRYHGDIKGYNLTYMVKLSVLNWAPCHEDVHHHHHHHHHHHPSRYKPTACSGSEF